MAAIAYGFLPGAAIAASDRKSTRLNSSHRCISYAVFCLKKKYTTTSNTAQAHADGHPNNTHASTPSSLPIPLRDAILLCLVVVLDGKANFYFFFLMDPRPPEIYPFPQPAPLRF